MRLKRSIFFLSILLAVLVSAAVIWSIAVFYQAKELFSYTKVAEESLLTAVETRNVYALQFAERIMEENYEGDDLRILADLISNSEIMIKLNNNFTSRAGFEKFRECTDSAGDLLNRISLEAVNTASDSSRESAEISFGRIQELNLKIFTASVNHSNAVEYFNRFAKESPQKLITGRYFPDTVYSFGRESVPE